MRAARFGRQTRSAPEEIEGATSAPWGSDHVRRGRSFSRVACDARSSRQSATRFASDAASSHASSTRVASDAAKGDPQTRGKVHRDELQRYKMLPNVT